MRWNSIFRITWGWFLRRCVRIICSIIQIIFPLSWVKSVSGGGQTGRRKSRCRLISLEHLLKVRIISLARAGTEARWSPAGNAGGSLQVEGDFWKIFLSYYGKEKHKDCLKCLIFDKSKFQIILFRKSGKPRTRLNEGFWKTLKSAWIVEISVDLREKKVSPDGIHLLLWMVSIRCKEHSDTATSVNNSYGDSVRNTWSRACLIRVETKMADRVFVNSF